MRMQESSTAMAITPLRFECRVRGLSAGVGRYPIVATASRAPRRGPTNPTLTTTMIQELATRILAAKQPGADAPVLQRALCAALLATIPAAGTQHVAATSTTVAASWLAAQPALQAVYSWDSEAVVTGVIRFWQCVCARLATGVDEASAAGVQDQQYVAWLWQQLGADGAAAIVGCLHQFWCLTGINHLPHTMAGSCGSPTNQHMLLLFVELATSEHSAAASQQLLQMLAASPQQQQQQQQQPAATTAAALTACEAFAGVTLLLQVSASLQDEQGPIMQLAARAGAFLREGYGWCDWGEAAAMGESGKRQAEAAAAAPTRHRPASLPSLYDCFMQQLLCQLLQDPASDTDQAGTQQAATASRQAASASDDAWQDLLASDSFAALAALLATYDRPATLIRGLHIQSQQQLLQRQTAAAAACEATAPRPAPAPSAGSKARNKDDKAMLQRVMQLLEAAFLAAPAAAQGDRGAGQGSQGDGSGDDDAVLCTARQLLTGLSELLRPASNCAVEWRVATLRLMQTAVDTVQQGGGAAGSSSRRCAQLWSEASCEGLLYCLEHDPSVQARRAAASLLQHVVLPSSSPTAHALVRCLAAKVADKDVPGVGATALQLLLQLEPAMLCGCLTAAQWCTAVQAGLELVTNTEPSKGGNSPVPDATTQQFAWLLRAVMSSGVAHPAGGGGVPALHGNEVVGLHGCRQVVLQLMMAPELEEPWRRLQGAMQVPDE